MWYHSVKDKNKQDSRSPVFPLLFAFALFFFFVPTSTTPKTLTSWSTRFTKTILKNILAMVIWILSEGTKIGMTYRNSKEKNDKSTYSITIFNQRWLDSFAIWLEFPTRLSLHNRQKKNSKNFLKNYQSLRKIRQHSGKKMLQPFIFPLLLFSFTVTALFCL